LVLGCLFGSQCGLDAVEEVTFVNSFLQILNFGESLCRFKTFFIPKKTSSRLCVVEKILYERKPLYILFSHYIITSAIRLDHLFSSILTLTQQKYVRIYHNGQLDQQILFSKNKKALDSLFNLLNFSRKRSEIFFTQSI